MCIRDRPTSMSYSASSGSVTTMLCAVIVAQLYFLAASVDGMAYTPAGKCLCDNRCFDQVEVDYSMVTTVGYMYMNFVFVYFYL